MAEDLVVDAILDIAPPFEESERLKSLEEYRELTGSQKRILLEHIQHPELGKGELAKVSGVSLQSVYNFFHSKKFERISQELANQEKRELWLLAISTMRDLLKSPRESIRLAAASKLLADAGIMRQEPKVIKQDKTITVSWQGGKPFEPALIPLVKDAPPNG